MQECNLEWHDKANRIVICVTCKRIRQTTQTNIDTIHYICKENRTENTALPIRIQEVDIPPTLTRLKNFSMAALKHVAKGNPTCDPAEVERRFEICKSNKCGFYKEKGLDRGMCAHISCGCNLAGEVEYLNKLAWPEQRCPMDFWGPVEPKKEDNKTDE